MLHIERYINYIFYAIPIVTHVHLSNHFNVYCKAFASELILNLTFYINVLRCCIERLLHLHRFGPNNEK